MLQFLRGLTNHPQALMEENRRKGMITLARKRREAAEAGQPLPGTPATLTDEELGQLIVEMRDRTP